jgi:hypothetical protein
MSKVRNCCHDHLDGKRCGAVALKHQSYCYFHQEFEDRKRRRLAMIERLGGTDHTHLNLPPVEDRASAMIAINEVIQALAFGLIDRPTARTFFAGFKLALSNIKSTSLLPDFMEPDDENAPSMAEALLARLAEIPMPKHEDFDSAAIPEIKACVERFSLTQPLPVADVILSEGGLPRAVSSAGNPSRRTPVDLQTLCFQMDNV